jgi:hypothetical protein
MGQGFEDQEARSAAPISIAKIGPRALALSGALTKSHGFEQEGDAFAAAILLTANGIGRRRGSSPRYPDEGFATAELSVPGDRHDIEVLIKAKVVLTALAFHVLRLEDTRAFRLFLEGSAFAASGCDRLLELRNLCVSRFCIGKRTGGEQGHPERTNHHSSHEMSTS